MFLTQYGKDNDEQLSSREWAKLLGYRSRSQGIAAVNSMERRFIAAIGISVIHDIEIIRAYNGVVCDFYRSSRFRSYVSELGLLPQVNFAQKGRKPGWK